MRICREGFEERNTETVVLDGFPPRVGSVCVLESGHFTIVNVEYVKDNRNWFITVKPQERST